MLCGVTVGVERVQMEEERKGDGGGRGGGGVFVVIPGDLASYSKVNVSH